MSTKKLWSIIAILLILLSASLCRQKEEEEDEGEEESEQNEDLPIFSKDSGFYNSKFELTLKSSQNESIIYYTIDGSDPTTSNTSEEYTEPIQIKERTAEPNIYSEYQGEANSSISITTGAWYKKPGYNVDKAMVVRAVTKNSEDIFSPIVQKIYFIADKNLSQYKDYTVVSLVTNPENLFDPDIGIYVVGNQYLNYTKSEDYNPRRQTTSSDFPCNFCLKGSEWEREAQLSIFEKGELLVEQNVGIRIKGHVTRNSAQKNFNIYSKKQYGKKKIKAEKLFPNNYDAYGEQIKKYMGFTLRTVGDIRDTLGLQILKGREGQTSINTKIAVLFLNGEYWGVYTFLEKISIETYAVHYNIPKKDLIVIKENQIEDGTDEDFEEYETFDKEYSEKDLTNKTNYEEVCKRYDINSMIEHYASGIYLGTSDWPNRNFAMWRSKGEKIEGNPYSDGKWRFVCFDFDNSMGRTHAGFQGYESFAFDNFRYLYTRLKKYPGKPTDLFLNLLNNEEFKKKFIIVFQDYINDVATLEKAKMLANNLVHNNIDLFANSQIRWSGQTEETRKQAIERFKSNFANRTVVSIEAFFKDRPHYCFGHMKRFFELEGDINEITIEMKGEGKIKINTFVVDSEKGVWKGKYISSIPISISALNGEKSKFKGWSGDIQSFESSLVFNLTKAMKIEVNFENEE